MRRRSWAWAAEQRPPRALKARRWPRRRPRSTAGSTWICGSFIATPVPESETCISHRDDVVLLIIKELSGTEPGKSRQIRLTGRSWREEGPVPPDSDRKRDMHISPGRCSFVDNKGVKWH